MSERLTRLLGSLAALAGSSACVEVPDLGTDAGPTCTVSVDSTWPIDGAQDFYHRSALEFELSEPDPTAVVAAEFPGEQAVSADGLWISYLPDEPLEPETVYEAGLDYCHGSPRISFSTSELGLPVESGATMLGRTFELDLTSGRYLQSSDVAQAFSAAFDRTVLFEVQFDEGAGLGVLAGMSDGGEGSVSQDPCQPTSSSLQVDNDEAPFFSFRLDEFELVGDAGALTLVAFSLTGTIAPDAEFVGGITWEATAPAGQLGELMGLDAEELCELLEGSDAGCLPCPDGPQSCITAAADRMEAWSVPVALESVDVACTSGD